MLSEKIKNEIMAIVSSEIDLKEDFCLFLFGSRATNEEKAYSDIDIGIWGIKSFEYNIKNRIEEKFRNSNIPYKIDLIDFSGTDDSFKKISLHKVDVWKNPELMKNLLKKLKI